MEDAGINFYDTNLYKGKRINPVVLPPDTVLVEETTAKSPKGLITILETDPNGKPLNSPGAKADSGKLRPWLVLSAFSNALEEVSKVGTAGAKKYTDNGWVTVPDAENRYMDAFGRHLLKLGSGEVYDTGEGGIGTKHIAQMIWNLLAVLELQERNEKSTSKA
jgi:Domain of unknown function (DUF5664)